MLEIQSPLKGRYRQGILGDRLNKSCLRIQERSQEALMQIAAWPESQDIVWQQLETAPGAALAD